MCEREMNLRVILNRLLLHDYKKTEKLLVFVLL